MRAAALLVLLSAGCQGILGIPDDGTVGCPGGCTVTVDGKVLRADSVDPQPRADVRVALTSVPSAEAPKVTTSPTGAYALADLSPSVALELELSFQQTNPTVQPGLLVTRLLAGNAASDRTVDLPVVEFHWLAKVAFECGLFPTLEAATFEPGTQGVSFYYITRSTVIGEVRHADGSPATLDRADLTVALAGYANSHKNPADTTFPPAATVCFLEPDGASGSYRGVNADRSSSGRFVMFRVRNEGGTGVGLAEVRIPGYPPGRVNLRSSGSIGWVRIVEGEGEPPLVARTRTFERDVYPLLGEAGCVACHRRGGPGDEAPVRAGYHADWSGTVDQVYEALTRPPSEGCEAGGELAARVCLAKPEASLLYTKPRLETGNEPPDHKGVAFPDGTNILVVILEWIKDGAKLR